MLSPIIILNQNYILYKMEQDKYDVCIVGAGIIGMATAYFLSQSSLKICVVEQCDDVAKVTSEVNGGQINPTRVDHLHAYIKKVNLMNMLKVCLFYPVWGIHHVAYKLKLSKHPSLDAQMSADIKKTAVDTMTYMKDMQWTGLKIGKRARLADMVDPLKKITPPLNNYLIGTGSSHDLAHILKKKCPKIDFFFNHRFLSFHKKDGKVTKIITDKKMIKADKYILTMGFGLSRWFPLLPVYGLIRVYPFSHSSLFQSPNIILGSMPSRHAYMNIVGNTLRLGGGDIISPFKPTLKAFHLPRWGNHKPTREWIGHRPVSPDGMPIIGKLPGYKNVYVNGGHGFWGWTLSLGTAKVLTNHLLHNKPIPTTFSPRRFL